MLCRIWLYFIFIASGSIHMAAAGLLPTSRTMLGTQVCRLDLYHLAKNQSNRIENDFQIALIADQGFNRRYVALKADISYPKGFENFSYYRTGQPVEVFTANWKNYYGSISVADTNRSYSISHLVRLGGSNPRQAFDVLIRLIAEDHGHFELQSASRRYRFYLEDGHLDAFFHCLHTE
ncbi:hypothetical protein L4174_017830 [Photobacterium sp. CCB-ST2H9]|uniref:hypothetical protein n=1 Tax=unclassified Photobacterium TaxID=2628852 RepID=UPI0020058076|nr:hypothetical protein [Photobacterium sp. CCB-ST2H9]UTM59930.1 hypothetical protein L4174_017830 [Photobacterium sp. CCB-ST2H9]